MNPIIKIINSLIIAINRLIDSLDKKTIEIIKQAYYLTVFIIVIIGIAIGYNAGKHSAKKYGKPLSEYTDDVFDVVRKRERTQVKFSSMAERDRIIENEKSGAKKTQPRQGELPEPEFRGGIVEPDNFSGKKIFAPSADMKDRIAEVKKLDEIAKPAGIRPLEKKHSDSPDNDRKIHKRGNDDLIVEPINRNESVLPNETRTAADEKKPLLPLEKNRGVIEK